MFTLMVQAPVDFSQQKAASPFFQKPLTTLSFSKSPRTLFSLMMCCSGKSLFVKPRSFIILIVIMIIISD